MMIVGLTGSIGMGKSTAASMIRRMGVPVYDSDAAVHCLLGRGGGAVKAVGAAFPGVVRNGAVDRGELGRRVFDDPSALAQLEAIVHPRVRRKETAFLRRAAARRKPLVVLDIPLLFETGGESRCDAVIVVSAPAFLQRQRVLSRPGMTEAKLQGILARQMPDAEKRRRADFVVSTGLGKRVTFDSLRAILCRLRSGKGTRWPPPRPPRFRNVHAPDRP